MPLFSKTSTFNKFCFSKYLCLFLFPSFSESFFSLLAKLSTIVLIDLSLLFKISLLKLEESFSLGLGDLDLLMEDLITLAALGVLGKFLSPIDSVNFLLISLTL